MVIAVAMKSVCHVAMVQKIQTAYRANTFTTKANVFQAVLMGRLWYVVLLAFLLSWNESIDLLLDCWLALCRPVSLCRVRHYSE